MVLELFARNLRPGPQSDNGNENGQGPDTAPLGAQDDSGRKASGEQDHTPNNPGPDSNSKSHPNLDASAKESDSERERDESGNGPKQRGWWISVGNEAPKFNELGVGYEYCAR